MAGQAKREIDHFNNGFMSYPRGRICYPENLVDEDVWLAGWYRAKMENDIELESVAQDTYAWHYKTGN